MSKTASFTIGRVTGVHGLNGNLKVQSYAESVDSFSPGSNVLLKAGEEKGRPFVIERAQPHKKGLLLCLDGVDSRTLAEELVGMDILVDRDQLPEPEDGTWFWQDLIGLDVVDQRAGHIGRITDIFPTGAREVLVVKGAGKEILIPMHRQFVVSVDLDRNTMETALPEGL